MVTNNRIPFFSASYVITALRAGPYKDTMWALAELLDNSIEALSFINKILLIEDFHPTTRRRVLNQIAVLDCGIGMTKDLLTESVSFGRGSHLNQSSSTKYKFGKLGKYGIGLPQSSVSQATKVEVWSWTKGKGINKSLYTYLDVNEIIKGSHDIVPEPILKSIPNNILKLALDNEKETEAFSESGTLVLWSGLDRISPKTADTLVALSR